MDCGEMPATGEGSAQPPSAASASTPATAATTETPPAKVATSAPPAKPSEEPKLPVVSAGSPPKPQVFLDLKADDKPLGRLVIQLEWDVVPKTAENFRALCVGAKGKGYHFKGKSFSRIFPGFAAQGVLGVNSIYGSAWEEENFEVKHTEAGVCLCISTLSIF